MKKFIVISSLIFLASVLNFSCNKETTGELKVLVKADNKYWGNITVKIYNSLTAKQNDSAYATAKTTVNQPEVYGALFLDLPPQKYYIKAEFTDGSDQYSGEGEATVQAGKQEVYTLECNKAAVGSLEVFVRENSLTGAYVPNANVELYLSETDRANGYFFKSSTTPSVDFDKNGALFEGLLYQKYYLKAYFTKNSELWMGVAETFIIPGQKKVINVLCVK
ncbi:MAG TPA: hypothetical protein P5050_08235 [Bacteroidia bacterium]|nr:hypothetical protein [Bacteroidia bacterium]HRS59193.1 hypothetical protein [Bacteroidia bacterium]HRU67241.1 hypothetical protein [Bacteroidia bacterium]